jgi:hypothetical protein
VRTVESAGLLHTQEVRVSSPCAPTICFNSIILRRWQAPHWPTSGYRRSCFFGGVRKVITGSQERRRWAFNVATSGIRARYDGENRLGPRGVKPSALAVTWSVVPRRNIEKTIQNFGTTILSCKLLKLTKIVHGQPAQKAMCIHPAESSPPRGEERRPIRSRKRLRQPQLL